MQDDPSVFTPPILPGLLRALGASRVATASSAERTQPRRRAARLQRTQNVSEGVTSGDATAATTSANESETSSSDDEDEDVDLDGTESGGNAGTSEQSSSRGRRSTNRQLGSLQLRLRDALRRVERIRAQGEQNSNSLDSFFEDMLMMMAQARGGRVAYMGDGEGEGEGRRHMQIGDYVIGDMNDVVNRLMQEDPGGAPSHSTSDHVLNKLPCVNYSMAEASPHKSQNEQCAVCREHFPWGSAEEGEAQTEENTTSEDDPVWALPCAHWFHRECCEQWLKDHNTCPVCRHELPTTDEEYNQSKNLSMQAFDRWRQAFVECETNRAEEAAKKVCVAASAST